MTTDPHAPYLVYKSDVSYFSGKLEAYLRYKNIPHEAREIDLKSINFEVYQNTGFKKVPAVHTADNVWLFDTTPMIEWFEQRYTEAPVLPDDPALAFLASLLEDYGDEWLWRPSMWWRWESCASRRAAGWRIGAVAGFGGAVVQQLLAWQFAWRQRREWLWDDGLSRRNAEHVRDLYLHELDDLQAILSQQPYLLGSHPSVADLGYFGSMFRHFSNDPDPAEVMRRRAPAVYEWTARLWNATGSKLGPEQHWRWPEGAHWESILKRVAGDYLPYLSANAQAWRDGKKRFDFQGQSLAFPGTKTTQYRVWCPERLRTQFQQLDPSDQARVEQALHNAGGIRPLTDGEPISSRLEDALQIPRPPLKQRRQQPLLMWLMGQSRN